MKCEVYVSKWGVLGSFQFSVFSFQFGIASFLAMTGCFQFSSQ